MAAPATPAPEESDELLVLKKRRPASDGGMIDFSPLCDMTFQLLAFFIMTVRLANQEMVDVPQISRGKGVEMTESTVFTILAAADPKSDCRMFLGNGRQGTEITLDDARSAIESGVAAGRANVIIKAEKLVPTGVVQRLMRVVSSVSGAELFIGVADKEN